MTDPIPDGPATEVLLESLDRFRLFYSESPHDFAA